jgi:hypothetical protein
MVKALGKQNMRDDAFIRQARQDAEKLGKRSEETRQRLNAETDWNGFRMRGYEFPDRRDRA